jgi:hypothetical protein
MPLLELLASSNNRIILIVLQLINIVVQNNAAFRDSICLLGMFSFTIKELFFSRGKKHIVWKCYIPLKNVIELYIYNDNGLDIFEGGIPIITKFASPGNPKEIRLACSEFVKTICSTGRKDEKKSFTLQMFIAARGFPALVEFLEPNFKEWKELIYNSIDAIAEIFELQVLKHFIVVAIFLHELLI